MPCGPLVQLSLKTLGAKAVGKLLLGMAMPTCDDGLMAATTAAGRAGDGAPPQLGLTEGGSVYAELLPVTWSAQFPPVIL